MEQSVESPSEIGRQIRILDITLANNSPDRRQAEDNGTKPVVNVSKQLNNIDGNIGFEQSDANEQDEITSRQQRLE